MGTFIDKKLRVYDLRLTPYAHYLMAIGKFRPDSYAFYDDNILYDISYAATSSVEDQSKVVQRIRDTHFHESQVLFEGVSASIANFPGATFDQFTNEPTPFEERPRESIYRYESMIGDARLDGKADYAPAWKIVALQSTITSSTLNNPSHQSLIPQLNIDANYRLTTVEAEAEYNPKSIRTISQKTPAFIDGRMIILQRDDPVFYVEELNTLLLTTNFDIEVFEVGSDLTPTALLKKYFRKTAPQIENGFLVSHVAAAVDDSAASSITGSVEYYFDVLTDGMANEDIACRGALQFNKESYYVDLDFDCGMEQEDATYYDIYGSVSDDIEICDAVSNDDDEGGSGCLD